jgi:hypothetical protein
VFSFGETPVGDKITLSTAAHTTLHAHHHDIFRPHVEML